MDKLRILKKLYEQQMNDVFRYSSNYLMTVPRRGFETDWEDAVSAAELLKGLIEENGGEV